MDKKNTTDRRVVLVAAAIFLASTCLPWLASVWPGGSLFGFPVSAFALLMLAPLLLALLAGLGPRTQTPDEGEDEA